MSSECTNTGVTGEVSVYVDPQTPLRAPTTIFMATGSWCGSVAQSPC